MEEYNEEMNLFLIYLVTYEEHYDKNNEVDIFANIMSKALMQMPIEEHDEAINESSPENLLIRVREYLGELYGAKELIEKNDKYYRQMFLARFRFDFAIMKEMEKIDEENAKKN